MDDTNSLSRRAYWLAWQMLRGRDRSTFGIARRLVTGGIPEEMALRVAMEVTVARKRKRDNSRGDLFSFGIFMLGLGTMIGFITFLITKSAVLLPQLLVLGSGITVAGLVRRVRPQ